MPDTIEAPVTDQKESFGAWRNGRETGQPETGREPAEKPAAASTEPAKPAAESETASEQSKVEKRKAEIQREIDALTRQREDLKRKLAPKQPEPAIVSRGTSEQPKEPSNDEAQKAAADGTDPKDIEPVRPDQTKYSDWAKFDTDMEQWRVDRAAWVARKEWRKADAAKEAKATEDRQRFEQTEQQKRVQKDLSDFETEAHDWAKEEGADDFEELFAEIKKRPVLSAETGSVTMYGGKDGARLLHHLMSNPELLEEIEKAPRIIDRLNKLYELKHELKAEKAQKRLAPIEKPRSNAPPAGTRLSGTGGGSGGKDPTTFESFRKQRHA